MGLLFSPRRFRRGFHLYRSRCLAAIRLVLVVWLSAGATGRATSQTTVRTIDLQTSDLVYDPFTRAIYASVPSAAGPPHANQIVPVNPRTGLVSRGTFAGSEPDRLALADDGSLLYIATRGNNQVVPFDLRTQTLRTPFDIGKPEDQVEDMAVVPGNPWALVVSRNPGPGASRNRGLAVFVSDRPLPVTVGGPINTITFGDSASVLYGHNSGTSPHNDLQTFRLDLSPGGGLIRVKQTNDTFGLYQDRIQYASGRIYSQRGDVIDPVKHSRAGKFSLPFGLHPFAADAANRSVY